MKKPYTSTSTYILLLYLLKAFYLAILYLLERFQRNHKEFLTMLKTVEHCIKMGELLQKGKHNVESYADDAGLALQAVITHKITDPRQGEALLISIGRVFEYDTSAKSENEPAKVNFAKNKTFVGALVSFVEAYINETRRQEACISHYAFELVVYIILGIVEKTSLLKCFLSALSVEQVTQLVQDLSSIIMIDELYLTQVYITREVFLCTCITDA